MTFVCFRDNLVDSPPTWGWLLNYLSEPANTSVSGSRVQFGSGRKTRFLISKGSRSTVLTRQVWQSCLLEDSGEGCDQLIGRVSYILVYLAGEWEYQGTEIVLTLSEYVMVVKGTVREQEGKPGIAKAH